MILDNTLISLDKDNDLEEEITYLFNEVSTFIFKFKKNTTNQALNVLKTCTFILDNFERSKICFLI